MAVDLPASGVSIPLPVCPETRGRVPEWTNGADCKSVAQASWVRIPPRPFLFDFVRRWFWRKYVAERTVRLIRSAFVTQ